MSRLETALCALAGGLCVFAIGIAIVFACAALDDLARDLRAADRQHVEEIDR